MTQGVNLCATLGTHYNGTISNFSVRVSVDLVACDMLSLKWGDYNASIVGTAVSLTVPYGTSLTALNPTYTTSYGATGLPASGSAPNFTGGPVDYTITSPDGAHSKVYQVTVTEAAPSTACNLLAMSLGGIPGVISGTDVTLFVAPGATVTSLTPVCSISPLASVAPAAGIAQDFTTPVEYTVTAQDGSTHTHYQVKVSPSLTVAGFPSAPNNSTWYGGNEGTFASADGITATFSGNWGMAAWKWAGGMKTSEALEYDINFTMNSGSGNGYFGLCTAATGRPIYPHWPIGGAGAQLGLSQNTGGAVVFPNENAGTRGTVASTTTWNLKFNMAAKTMTLTGGVLSLTASATSVIDTGDLWIAFGREGCRISNFSVTRVVNPTACDMLSLQWGSYTGIITGTAVSLLVPDGTPLTTLNPTYTTSTGFTGLPASGSAPDFSGGPVAYTITALDGIASKTYTVTVTYLPPTGILLTTANSGSGTLAFATAPPADQWSTATMAGAQADITTPAGLDAAVATLTAGGITTALPTVAEATPGSNALARYNSQLLLLQSKPTGTNKGLVLMATLRNMTGSPINGLTISCAMGTPVNTNTEEVPGLRAYYSMNGTTWTGIPDLCTATAGNPTTNVDLSGTPLAASTVMYVLWADDNANGSDNAYTIDDASFAIYNPVTGYAAWKGSHAGGQTPDLDFNNDGVSNGAAYFMGMDGLATNPGVVDGKVTWPHVNAVASFEVQVSDNLTDWSPATSGVDTSDPSKVVFTLPTGPGITKTFCRLMVVP
ncbi:MAG: DUF5018 domain-containing protein [Verrucomicrobia bacterium]|nr:DUF5018 domain-containing protein [Verrucomicrobiota bacterium]